MNHRTINKKKHIRTSGHLIAPLRLGEPAWIAAGGHSYATSTVMLILEVMHTGVMFETRNTVYDLNYDTTPDKTEVKYA